MTLADRFTLRSAVYLLPVKGNKVLLARRFNTGWMDGKYSLISGHLDGNETVSQAMIREAYEEAGIKITSKDLIPMTVIHRKSRDAEYIDFFFMVKKWTGQPVIAEPDKCDAMDWFSVNKLPDSLLPHIKVALECYKNKVAFAEFGWK